MRITNKNEHDLKLTQHVIAYIDILGTKELQNTVPDKMAEIFDNVYSFFESAINSVNEDKDNFPKKGDIKFKIFSDNILFAIEATSEDAVMANASYLISVVALFQNLILFAEPHLLFRGGICCGDLFADNLFVIGKGLVNAYYLEDHDAIYPRIIVENTLALKILDKTDDSNAWDSALLPDEDNHYFLNYLHFAEKSQLENHYKIITNKSVPKDKDVLLKIDWMKNYHNTYCKHHNITNLIFEDVDFKYATPSKTVVLDSLKKLTFSGKEKVKDYSLDILGNPVYKKIISLPNKSIEESECSALYPILYFDGTASAGSGVPPLDYESSSILYITENPPENANFMIKIVGDSMEPKYKEGEYVFVDRASQPEIGDIGVFITNEGVCVKKRGEKGLLSLNPKYKIIKGNEDTRLVGKVIGKYTGEIAKG